MTQLNKASLEYAVKQLAEQVVRARRGEMRISPLRWMTMRSKLDRTFGTTPKGSMMLIKAEVRRIEERLSIHDGTNRHSYNES